MTITIDVWFLLPLCGCLFCGGVGLYERGQRKGIEAAEKLYEPLMKELKSRLGGDETNES
jgi:hypothetical protein